MPQSFDILGPLAALEVPSSKTAESFYYPSNLTSVTNHYVRFDAFTFEDTRYQQGVFGGQNDPKDAGLGIGKILGGLATLGVQNINPFTAIATRFGIPGLATSLTGLSASGATAASQNITKNGFGVQTLYSAFKGLRGIGNKKIANHIYLYTPDTMTVGYANKWDTFSLREEFGALADGLAAVVDKSQPGSAAVSAAMGAARLAGGIPGLAGIKGGVERFQQMAGFPINPMTETAYKQTEPRQFQFEFTMMPQSRAESEQIQSIVQQFAFHSAGEYASSELGGFLITPSVFDIKFMYLDRSASGTVREIENPWLRKVSTCACTNIAVDYTGGVGQWQAQEDGSPSAVRLTISFIELDIITKDRVANGY